MAFRKVTDSILYVGVNDHEVDLFEGQYVVPNGMAYNSYVILDDKIAVMDTVDIHFAQEWLNNIAEALDGKKPTYLVVQHMEPDHSASIGSPRRVQQVSGRKISGDEAGGQCKDLRYDAAVFWGRCCAEPRGCCQ